MFDQLIFYACVAAIPSQQIACTTTTKQLANHHGITTHVVNLQKRTEKRLVKKLQSYLSNTSQLLLTGAYIVGIKRQLTFNVNNVIIADSLQVNATWNSIGFNLKWLF